MPLETRVYEKENNIKLLTHLKDSIVDFKNSLFLSKQLATRDIQSQYKQSYLGIIWAFLTPITTAAVWIFLNKSGIINLTDTGVPYPVYAFTGTLLWSVLIDSINSPTASTNAARSILAKVNFPKEALILSGIYKLLFNTSIKIVLLLVFIVFYGVGLNWSLLLFPFALLGIVFFGTSLGMLITPIGMLYNDVGKIIGLGMRFLMYAAPVVYIVPKSGIMKTIMELNPLTPLISVSRALAVGSEIYYFEYYIWVLVFSIPVFFISLMFYRLSIPIIVERSNG
ncbi:lipopolysaccharide transport system permease protein [Flavobacteriaceae bacterium MAR_2010_188]|nr:lipopolysaccharide transport system permease protein [Flavobacteriaceae bacterium MAR_2010_188]